MPASRSWLRNLLGRPSVRSRPARRQLSFDLLEDRLVPTGLPPAVLIDSPPDVAEGGTYRLNLTAVDPENDPVTAWTVNWGDGTTETFAGNPSSVTHTYAAGPAVRNVTATAEVGGETFTAVVSTVGAYQGVFAGGSGGQLLFPRTLAFTGDGNLYIGDYDDSGNNRLLVRDAATGAVSTIATQSTGLAGRPFSLAAGPDGSLFVSTLGSVQRYNPATGVLDTFIAAGTNGLGRSGLLSVGPDGTLYVGDGADNRILRFDATTGALGVFVELGTLTINDMAVGPNGDLYATSYTTFTLPYNSQQYSLIKIVRFDGATGARLADFVAAGSGELGKEYVNTSASSSVRASLAFGPDGDLYVSAPFATGTRILRYDGDTGEYLGQFTGGELSDVRDLAFGPDGDLYVPTHGFSVSAATSLVARFAGPQDGTAATAVPLTVLDTVSNTYTSSPNASIPSDLKTYEWAITVPGGGQVVDVDLGITITHSNVRELYIYLISPAGTRVPLVRGLDLPGANFTGTVFDDEAATAITAGTAPFTGRYRPMRPLSDFDGEGVQGTWRLQITDRVKANRGTLNNWSLTITRGVAPPPPNRAPVAASDSAATVRGQAVTVAVLANDTDPDGDALAVTVTQPANGAAVVNPDGTVTYTPAAGFTGTDTFTYTIDDGEFTSSAGVTVAVSPPPTLSVAGVSLREGRSGVTAFTFTVTLSAPSAAEVRVQFATQDGTAQAGSDYKATSGWLVFAPGQTTATVTVDVYGDRAKELDETFFIDFTSLFGGVRGRGTILNDD